MKHSVVGLMGAVLMVSTVANAAPKLFSEPMCFTSKYDSTHLKEHPKQKVSQLWLMLKPSPEQASDSFPISFARLFARFKSDSRFYAADEGTCSENTDGTWRCGVDCDGGGWNIRQLSDGNILVKPEQWGIRVTSCGDEQMWRTISPKDDQKVFQLAPAALGQCKEMESRWE